uniref:Uncharacterized protein n=1 Tax=Micrurus corallinus TaxID=54390 RepID=A0A2D4FFB2_MICCO
MPALSHSSQPKNSEKSTENGVSSKIDTVRTLLRQLDDAVRSGKWLLQKNIQYPVLGPTPSRMASFFDSGSCQSQISLFYLVSEIYELDTNGLEDSTAVQERIGHCLKSLLEQLTGMPVLPISPRGILTCFTHLTSLLPCSWTCFGCKEGRDGCLCCPAKGLNVHKPFFSLLSLSLSFSS